MEMYHKWYVVHNMIFVVQHDTCSFVWNSKNPVQRLLPWSVKPTGRLPCPKHEFPSGTRSLKKEGRTSRTSNAQDVYQQAEMKKMWQKKKILYRIPLFNRSLHSAFWRNYKTTAQSGRDPHSAKAQKQLGPVALYTWHPPPTSLPMETALHPLARKNESRYFLDRPCIYKSNDRVFSKSLFINISEFNFYIVLYYIFLYTFRLNKHIYMK